jgi:phosphate:Na+ symporter
MVDLTQIVTGLECVSDVVATNLTSVSQQRLTEGIDLSQSRDENTSRFADAVIRDLEQAVQTISQPDADKVAQIVAAEPEIEALAAAARVRQASTGRYGRCAEIPSGLRNH